MRMQQRATLLAPPKLPWSVLLQIFAVEISIMTAVAHVVVLIRVLALASSAQFQGRVMALQGHVMVFVTTALMMRQIPLRATRHGEMTVEL